MSQRDLSRAVWHTSSRSSGSGQCVAVAFVGDTVATRDSKNNTGPVLLFTSDQWRTFVHNGRIRAQ